VKIEVAIGFFGAYSAVLSIIALYQTLVLQGVLDRTDRSEREFVTGTAQRQLEQRRRRANSLAFEAAFFVVAVTIAFLLVASYSDAIAGMVDSLEAPREAFTYATWVLRALFLVVTGFYTLRLWQHPFLRRNVGWSPPRQELG